LVYTFTTPKLQPQVTKSEGKNLIQACLNAPEPPTNQENGSEEDQTRVMLNPRGSVDSVDDGTHNQVTGGRGMPNPAMNAYNMTPEQAMQYGYLRQGQGQPGAYGGLPQAQHLAPQQ